MSFTAVVHFSSFRLAETASFFKLRFTAWEERERACAQSTFGLRGRKCKKTGWRLHFRNIINFTKWRPWKNAQTHYVEFHCSFLHRYCTCKGFDVIYCHLCQCLVIALNCFPFSPFNDLLCVLTPYLTSDNDESVCVKWDLCKCEAIITTQNQLPKCSAAKWKSSHRIWNWCLLLLLAFSVTSLIGFGFKFHFQQNWVKIKQQTMQPKHRVSELAVFIRWVAKHHKDTYEHRISDDRSYFWFDNNSNSFLPTTTPGAGEAAGASACRQTHRFASRVCLCGARQAQNWE